MHVVSNTLALCVKYLLLLQRGSLLRCLLLRELLLLLQQVVGVLFGLCPPTTIGLAYLVCLIVQSSPGLKYKSRCMA